MDFCQSGGVGRKEISCFLLHQLTIVLAGLYVFWQSTAHGRGLISPRVCLVRIETSLAGVLPGSLTCFPTLKVLPAAWGSITACLGTARLLVPEMPDTSSPRKPCRLHQPPVPVLNHTRKEKHHQHLTCIPQRYHITGYKAIKAIAFICIVTFLRGPQTLHMRRRVSREVGAQETGLKFMQVNLRGGWNE